MKRIFLLVVVLMLVAAYAYAEDNIKCYSNNGFGESQIYSTASFFSEATLLEAERLIADIKAATGKNVFVATGQFYLSPQQLGTIYEQDKTVLELNENRDPLQERGDFLTSNLGDWMPRLSAIAQQDLESFDRQSILLVFAGFASPENRSNAFLIFSANNVVLGENVPIDIRTTIRNFDFNCPFKVSNDQETNDCFLLEVLDNLYYEENPEFARPQEGYTVVIGFQPKSAKTPKWYPGKYANKDDAYHVQYLNGRVVLQIQHRDADLSQVKWKLGRETLTTGDTLALRTQGITWLGNNRRRSFNIKLYDQDEVFIMVFKLKLYNQPLIKFETGDGYDGEFLCDDASVPQLQQAGDYLSYASDVAPRDYLSASKKAEFHTYAPVVGMISGLYNPPIRLKTTIELHRYGKKDPNLELFVEQIDADVQINGRKANRDIGISKEGGELRILVTIDPKEKLVRIKDQVNETTAKIQLKAKEIDNKRRKQIWVYHVDDGRGIRTDFTKQRILDILNKRSHNQFFLEHSVLGETTIDRNIFWESEKERLKLRADTTGTIADFYEQVTIKKEGNWSNQINGREIVLEMDEKVVVLDTTALSNKAEIEINQRVDEYFQMPDLYQILRKYSDVTPSLNFDRQVYNNGLPGDVSIIITRYNYLEEDPSTGTKTARVGYAQHDMVFLFNGGTEKTLAHEMGHDLSLPHTFCKYETGNSGEVNKACQTLVSTPGRYVEQGKTKANLMDYGDKRNMFFIYQVENIKL